MTKIIEKTLFLRNDTNYLFFNHMSKLNKMNYYRYKPGSFLFKVYNKLNLQHLMFGWKKYVKKYSIFILGENDYMPEISKYIKKHNKEAKVIMYFMNIINNDFYKSILIDRNIDEFWTFDKGDSRKYNLKYNPQFYTNEIKIKNHSSKKIYFLGRDKGRKNEINSFIKILDDKKIKHKFNFIENENDYISYDKYLEELSSSSCIFDYNQKKQIGLTLRPLESLFFEKKLITNNIDIINYEFYNKNNIFIIGHDDYNQLEEFINGEYKKISKNIINYYDYKEWIERFK